MAKAKTAFVCNDCGADFPKWQGQCGECHAWNTLSEIRLSAPVSKAAARAGGRAGYAGTVASVQRLE
ncbi:MAG: DNA repair protein RadA, partial [Halieaceae bacterium]